MPNIYQFTATSEKPITKAATKGKTAVSGFLVDLRKALPSKKIETKDHPKSDTEAKEKAMSDADPLYYLGSALSKISHPREAAVQLEKDLKRYDVVIDGVSGKGKEQVELFKASPELYGLHQGVSADAVKLMMRNFTLNGKYDTIVPYGLLQKGNYKKQGEVYSYEISLPVYTLSQMDELGEKRAELSDQENKMVDVNKLVPFACTMKVIASVDLSNKDNPVSTFQLTVESENPSFKYQGPRTPEVQVKEMSEKLQRRDERVEDKENKGAKETAQASPKEKKKSILHGLEAFMSGGGFENAFTHSPRHNKPKVDGSSKSPPASPPPSPRKS